MALQRVLGRAVLRSLSLATKLLTSRGDSMLDSTDLRMTKIQHAEEIN